MRHQARIIAVATEAMQREVQKALSGTSVDVVIVDDIQSCHNSTKPDDGRTGRIVVCDSFSDFSALERRIVAHYKNVQVSDTHTLHSYGYLLQETRPVTRKATKSKLFASPYGPQKGRKR